MATFGTWQNPLLLGGPGGVWWWYDFATPCWRKRYGDRPASETDGIEQHF